MKIMTLTSKVITFVANGSSSSSTASLYSSNRRLCMSGYFIKEDHALHHINVPFGSLDQFTRIRNTYRLIFWITLSVSIFRTVLYDLHRSRVNSTP